MYGWVKWTVRCFKDSLNCQAQRIVIKVMHIWRPITHVVPQGLRPGPILFSVFISELNDRTECTLTKTTDYTKIRSRECG